MAACKGWLDIDRPPLLPNEKRAAEAALSGELGPSIKGK